MSKSIIALDVGTKRIGIAISDTSQNFAFPRGSIERKNCINSTDKIGGKSIGFLIIKGKLIAVKIIIAE